MVRCRCRQTEKDRDWDRDWDCAQRAVEGRGESSGESYRMIKRLRRTRKHFECRTFAPTLTEVTPILEAGLLCAMKGKAEFGDGESGTGRVL